jgi:hypothetical protein
MRISIILSLIICSFLLVACATKVVDKENINVSDVSANDTIKEDIVLSDDSSTENMTGNDTQAANESIAIDETDTKEDEIVIDDGSSSTKEENQILEKDPCLLNAQDRGCEGPAGLPCVGRMILNSDDKTLIFGVQNDMGEIIELKDAADHAEGSPWQCMTRCVAESAEISLGEEFLDIHTNQKIMPTHIFEIRINCSEIGEYLNQGFVLSYADSNGTDHDAYFKIRVSE